MASMTISLDDKLYSRILKFPWINWSEVSRERIMKREIFNRYIQTGTITDEDWGFCEQIDWHPVDELPLREDFVKELEQRRKGPFIKLKSVSEIFEK